MRALRRLGEALALAAMLALALPAIAHGIGADDRLGWGGRL